MAVVLVVSKIGWGVFLWSRLAIGVLVVMPVSSHTGPRFLVTGRLSAGEVKLPRSGTKLIWKIDGRIFRVTEISGVNVRSQGDDSASREHLHWSKEQRHFATWDEMGSAKLFTLELNAVGQCALSWPLPADKVPPLTEISSFL